MKKLFIVAVLSCTSLIFAQQDPSFTVTYKLKTLLDINTLPDSIQESGFNMEVHLKLRNQMEAISFQLKVNDSISEYKISDELNTFVQSDNWLLEATKKNRWFVDDATYIQQTYLLEQEYLIAKASYQQNWILEEGTKTILGYPCKRASRNRDDLGNTSIIAWYTEDIPYQFGPVGNHGLPGLILEILQNEKMVYYATEIDFEGDVYAFKPSTGYKISQEDFNNKLNFNIESFSKKN
ncbi:MAG: hypothetical protein CMC15_04830 [Flavobacteriaceae bacterium]|nr:hypothetical protein [Flavobacteriaceae bacterium]